MDLARQMQNDLARLANSANGLGLVVDLRIQQVDGTYLLKGWWREDPSDEPAATAWIRTCDLTLAGGDIFELVSQSGILWWAKQSIPDELTGLTQIMLRRAVRVILHLADGSMQAVGGWWQEDAASEVIATHDRSWTRQARLRLAITAGPITRTTKVANGDSTWAVLSVRPMHDVQEVMLRRVEPIEQQTRKDRIR